MIIEIKCKSCGEITKVKINKVLSLQKKIIELEKDVSSLNAVIKFKKQNESPYSDILGDIFK